ncbi:MAG: DUF1223 domain-containing protein [Hyphomicrobiales bacterium]|nr:DUF1223 domain-containing protein [Hyphomicrobiales bacterium]
MNSLTRAAKLFRAPAMMAAALALTMPQLSAIERKQKSLIELFTSQGCPACPAADALLHKFSKRDDVIVLSLSVHYWDYIGWKDTLATPGNTQRQKDYARRKPGGEGRIYTPQMVVNGAACAPAIVKDKIEAELARTNVLLKDRRVTINGRHDGPALIVQVGGRAENSPASATVWLARVSPSAEVAIHKGENSGKKISYVNVVRALKRIGKWDGKPIEYEAPFEAANSDFYVAILQSDIDGVVIGAVDIH